MAIEAYPLQWPAGWPRTPSYRRKGSPFNVTLAVTRDGLIKEVRQLGGRNLVINSNLKLRQDGYPYAQQSRIEDHAIAVYFDYKGKPMCFACDTYQNMEANMRAIEKTINALRGIERWGASDMMERAFTGFAAIGHQQTEHWSDVLGVPRNATRDEIETEWRRLRSLHHPDKGGNPQTFQAVKEAYEAAIAP